MKKIEELVPLIYLIQLGIYSLAVIGETNAVASHEPETNIEPTILIAIFIRNKAHTLPYFLTLLEGLDYPKDRIALW